MFEKKAVAPYPKESPEHKYRELVTPYAWSFMLKQLMQMSEVTIEYRLYFIIDTFDSIVCTITKIYTIFESIYPLFSDVVPVLVIVRYYCVRLLVCSRKRQ
jgi:hypothetical protein